MKDIDLTGKCGSCYYFHPMEGTANGECHKFPYGDDVVHDAAHPFFQPGRSRIKCKNYRTTPITHADQIRSNTDKELANWLAGRACPDIGECPYIDQEVYGDDRDCGKCWLDWLKQECET